MYFLFQAQRYKKNCTFVHVKRIILALLSIFSLCARAQSVEPALPFGPEAPKHELRGVWLTTLWGLDWPKTRGTGARVVEEQKKALRSILDELQEDGINTVFLQTRVRGTVIYPSRIEPWDGCFTGKEGRDPGWDPLAFAIDECHKRGMELHAWVVTLPMGKTQSAKVVRAMKLLRHDGAYYMDPTRAETAHFIANICREIVSRYDVDGIHFDYIRYPEGFKRSRQKPELITRIVEESHKAVKQLKPWVRFSCSPIGKAGDLVRQSAKGWSSEAVGQDALGWVDRGLMDLLCPMMYFKGDIFYPFAADWQERTAGKGLVAPGMGIYFLSPKEKDWPLEEITRELSFLRQMGLGGAVYFREQFLSNNVKGLRSWLRTYYYRTPALLPPLQGAPADSLACPVLTACSHRGGEGLYTVEGAPRYVLYASETEPVDTGNPANIVRIVYGNGSPSGRAEIGYNMLTARAFGLHLAVTALDRWGRESAPLPLPLIE